MSKEQALEYLNQNAALSKMTNTYELAAQVAEKFSDGLVPDFEKMGADTKKQYLKEFEQLTKDLSEEDLALAVNIMADADSIEEFENQILQLSAKSKTKEYEALSTSLTDMLSSGMEDKSFKKSEINTLSSNEEFADFLKSSGKTVADFEVADFEEQYNMITEFYGKVQALRHDSVQYQKQLYYDDLLNQQEVLDKMYNMTAAEEGASLKLKKDYAEKKAQLNKEGLSEAEKETIQAELRTMASNYEARFGWDIELDTTDVKNKMQEITDQIKALDKQQIEIAIEWDGIEEIEQSFKGIGDFAGLMQKDAKKVGNSYQLTAAQAREWMEVYPDLFKQAEIADNGIISLDQSVVDNYISGQEEQTEANIDAKITQLEAERQSMEAKMALTEADLEAAYANYRGQEQLAEVSAEYLADQRKSLTQYYMDLGMDEVEADTAALKTMGLNEKQYTDLVAEAATKNSQNQISAVKEGGEAQVKTLSKLAEKWKKFTTFLKQVGAAIKAIFTGGNVKEAWNSVDSDFNLDNTGSTFTGAGNLSEKYSFEDLDEQKMDAARESVNSKLAESLESSKAEIQKALDSIDSQIKYLEALKNQDAKDFGNTSIDDDDKNDKDLEELEENLERYHEITREIEAQERAVKRLADQSDRAYGKNRLKLLQDQSTALKAQYERQKDLLEIQKAYLAMDLNKIQNSFVTGVELDENGNISNYSKLVDEATERLNRAKEGFNNSMQNDEDKKALEAAKKAYEDQIKALEQYEETLDSLNDQADTVLETFYQLQDLRFEELNYSLELKMDINDQDLELLNYYIGKIEDDVYHRAEALSLLYGKYDLYTSNLQGQEEFILGLKTAYENNKISEPDYIQGLKDANSNILENLQNLQELDDAMMNYYSDTLAAANEEISKYTELMEHQASVLDHYLSLVTLLGKETDYEKIGVVLEGQAAVAENAYEVSKKHYETMAAQAAARKAEYEAAVAEGAAKEELELLEKNWLAAQNAANEAQDQMLSDAEAWAESLKAILENKLAKAGQVLENALTGAYGSFDEMTKAMERANSLQEEYLTTTNQIYETNKLMRTAQKEIDKTTNQMAKAKLKQFVNETNQLQKQGKLSKFELEIQQAKYDLLLAEIALKEAQNAKSTVRLQRDSEGNFGYVYTADQSVIDNAMQAYEDAENSLYNKGLEAANNYVQKYQQTMAEMYDELAAIQQKYLEGGFESEEEYHAAMEAAKEYYFDKLGQYSTLYQIAVTTDSRIVADAWSTDFGQMTTKTEDWKKHVEEYVDDTVAAFENWENASARIAHETIGPNLTSLKDKTKDITDANKDLATFITAEGGVIDALEDQLTAVANLTTEYGKQRDAIQEVIDKYEAWLALNAQEIKDKSGVEDEDLSDVPEDVINGTVGRPGAGRDFEEPIFNTYDNEGFDEATVKKAQAFVGLTGTDIDGKWGVKSKDKAIEMQYYSLAEVVEAMNKPAESEPAPPDPPPPPPEPNQPVDLTKYGFSTKNLKLLQSMLGTEQDGTWGDEETIAVSKLKYDDYGYNYQVCKSTATPDESLQAYLEYQFITGWKSGPHYAKYAEERTAMNRYLTTYGMSEDEKNKAFTEWVTTTVPGYTKALFPAAFDTGGYTGDWGPYGKMAMLHEKELVLNAGDTENFLASMELLHRILEIIDLQTMSSQLGGLLTSPNFMSNNSNMIEQNVHIEASFPNATNHSEIEEAFNNLINTASQYANRK